VIIGKKGAPGAALRGAALGQAIRLTS
jgi:hypothetical protein